MEERDEASGPLTVMQVDRSDPVAGELRGVHLWALVESVQSRRMNEVDRTGIVNQIGQHREVWMAQPDPLGAIWTAGVHQVDDRTRRRSILHIEREILIEMMGPEQVGERGDLVGQIGSHGIGDRPAAEPTTHHTVMVEHDHPICGDPGVGLQSRGAEPHRKGERLEGVLRGVGASATVGESDRRVE